MPAPSVFLDTSYVISLVNADDKYHQRAKRLDTELLDSGIQLVLHWGIVLEVGDGFAGRRFRHKGRDLIEAFLSQDGYTIVPLSKDLLLSAADLFNQRPDKDWGLTDCASFVLMQELGIHEALTADQHFVQAGYRALLLEE